MMLPDDRTVLPPSTDLALRRLLDRICKDKTGQADIWVCDVTLTANPCKIRCDDTMCTIIYSTDTRMI